MDLRHDAETEALREELRAWCQANWPLSGDDAALPEAEQRQLIRRRGRDAGWLFRTVPKAYGGSGVDTDVMKETVIREELDAHGIPWRASMQGVNMLVPTLLEVGTEAQRKRYIPPTLLGETIWCQGYSEPGSGSDLASLASRAELDGDEWVLNGQKIWTSQATDAQMMFGLFRTEPDAAKHAGISYLLVPMDRPGIDVRPLRMMQGGVDFCEVFFDDVRIPAENIVGARGEGWKVSRATLKHERMLIGEGTTSQRGFAALKRLVREVELNGRPAAEDPGIRQRLAEIEAEVTAQQLMVTRMLSAIHREADLEVMNEMMMAKLVGTDLGQRIAKLSMDLLEEVGLEAPVGRETEMGLHEYTRGFWVSSYMFSLGTAVAGGASNIQRNIIGERVLGLPRDARKA